MKILVIDDNEFKFANIKNILLEVDNKIEITWAKSRNSGLVSIMNHNVLENNQPFDLLICDNYLPVYDDDYRTQPFGKEIVEEVRNRYHLKDFPILMCSSELLEDFSYDYSITYNSSTYMNPLFEEVINDVKEKQAKRKILTKD